MRVLVLATLLVVAAARENYYRLPSPYSFRCQRGFCIKEERSESNNIKSQSECQLTCGQFGSLWPQPTGESQISDHVIHFNPNNMRITKLAATNPNVNEMLEEATRIFRRNIHFMHPDFPKSEKTPYTQEQKSTQFNSRENFQQQQRPFEFDHQNQFRQQQQQQQQQFSSNRFHSFNQRTNNEFQLNNIDEYPEFWEQYSPFAYQRYNSDVERQRVNIEITVTSPDDKLNLETDESYNLAIQNINDETSVTILAPTYYGARHALESLTQLISYDEDQESLMIVEMANVQDRPAYKYRGVTLDTSRNFYTKEELMSLVDSMSQNKMNVFHWHITDAASFPLYSTRVPQMAYYGSYSPKKVYYPQDIEEITRYARLRGVMVIPELDAPAHASAGWTWGAKERKGELVLCSGEQKPWFEVGKEAPSGQLNPVNPEVYNILGDLYKDMLEYFDPEYFHMGGDSVSFKCWRESPEIAEYLKANNRQSNSDEYFRLWNTFQSNAYAKLKEATRAERKVTPIITSSSFARNFLDKNDYIIHMHEYANASAIADYVNNGFRVIFSNPDQWRLDCSGTNWYGEKAENCPTQDPTWESFYDNSPLDMLYNIGVTNARTGLTPNRLRQEQIQEQQSQNQQQVGNPSEYVMGGTATMYSFETDGRTVQSKMWPKVSAMAERLWSDPIYHRYNQAKFDTTQKRLGIQRNRMVERGINADPLVPESCIQDESSCYTKEQYALRSETVGTPQAQ